MEDLEVRVVEEVEEVEEVVEVDDVVEDEEVVEVVEVEEATNSFSRTLLTCAVPVDVRVRKAMKIKPVRAMLVRTKCGE